jgi:superfamily II DNA/RNA helicase
VVDLQSKKKKWTDLKIPEAIQKNLESLKMLAPSIIQSQSVPLITENPANNYMFQAINGSGKTLSFGLPALMRVDATNPAIQVIILANTRELIRQITQVLDRVALKTEPQISVKVGDIDTPTSNAHIIVTNPRWIANRVTSRNPIDLSNLKMIVYDEADEIFAQEDNHPFLLKIIDNLSKKNIEPQHVLFSATFEPYVKETIKKFFKQLLIYPLQKESLRLKGVRMLKMRLLEDEKALLISLVYEELVNCQKMIFTNKKAVASDLEE